MGYLLTSDYRRYSVQQIVIGYGYELRIWVAAMVLPLVVIILFRQEGVREVFEGEGRDGRLGN